MNPNDKEDQSQVVTIILSKDIRELKRDEVNARRLQPSVGWTIPRRQLFVRLACLLQLWI